MEGLEKRKKSPCGLYVAGPWKRRGRYIPVTLLIVTSFCKRAWEFEWDLIECESLSATAYDLKKIDCVL